MSVEQGWQAYHQGQFDLALAQFDAETGPGSLIGISLTLLAMGRGSEALALAQNGAQREGSFTLQVLLSDLIGRQGGRAEAEQRLRGAVAQHPQDGFLRSLLGEQRIRQGKWELGTEDFIAAMALRDRRAVAHMQRVIADMVDAVAARRIPKEDGMRLINRIDYSMAKKPQELNLFFAAARRGINSNERLDRSRLIEPWSLHGNAGQSAPAPSSGPPEMTARQRAPQNKQPSTSPSGAPQGRPEPVAQRPAQTRPSQRPQEQLNGAASTRAPEPGGQRARTTQESRLRERVTREDQRLVQLEADQKNMSAILRQERSLNEALQDLVAPIATPVWPSQVDTPIDEIPSIGFSRAAILPGNRSINSRVFNLTGGDIQVQITLERCMHNLLTAAHSVKPTVLPFIPASIARVAVNLLDDFIAEMPPLSSLYQEEFTVDNPQLLGLGAFLGECIIQTYGAVWQYEDPPEQSKLRLGSQILDPMGYAKEFFTSRDIESVNFQALIAQADQAVNTSTSLATFVDHIDPTPGLEKDALLMSLATLWVDYRFVLMETKIQPIATSLELIEGISMTKMIPFAIDAQFVPAMIENSIDGAVDSDGRARMVYIRENGEFLLPGIRKHFERFLEIAALELNQQNAGQYLSWIQDLFRPGWTILHNPEAVSMASRRAGNNSIQAPRLRQANEGAELLVDGLTAAGSHRRIRLQYRPSENLAPFNLSIES